MIHFGVLGTARIAEAFMNGARASGRADVVAVASRDPERAGRFAERHGVARTCGYEELIADPAVEAVYIPLPNSLHAPWTIAAARAGKHVLCEKPLAASEAEARAMFDAADASGVVLLEAFPFRFQPQTLEVARLVAEGAIGEIRLVQATFGFTIGDPHDIRFDPALGGGALLDAGCYPVSFCRQVLGRRPDRVTAIARRAASGVDLTLAATLDYGDAIAQLTCSMGTAVHRHALLAGSGGVIETEYLNNTHKADAPSYRIKRGTEWTAPVETVPVPREDGFRLEIDAFVDLVSAGDRAAVAAHRSASLDNAWTLGAILDACAGS